MSTKYYAKLLPSEGEIKAGDHFLDVATKLIVRASKEAEKAFLPNINRQKGSYKKVELFLCSQDIKEGDEYYTIRPGYTAGPYIAQGVDASQVWYYPNDQARIYTEREFAFKKMELISPDAFAYVKDGDVFNEEQIRRNHICYDSPGNTGYCFHCHRSKACNSEDYNYLIKGPCGHFH